MGTDLLDGDVELTEFELLDVQRVKGVGKGANGFPHLLMKGLAAPVAKGARDCEGCGKSYDADSKADNCEGCGKKLPAAPDASKASDEPKCATCKDKGTIMDGNRDCPDCDAKPASKGVPAWHSPAALLVRLARQEPTADRAALFKAVNADGQVDEQPDIDGGKAAIALIAQLIQYEAQELAAGCLGESWDIALLCDAIGALKAWLSGEVATQMAETADGTGAVMASAAQEKPGEDTSSKSVAEGGDGVDTGREDTGSLSKAVEDALTKALAPIKADLAKEIADLRALKAKVEAAPVPGGPVISTVRAQRTEGGEDWAAKAAYYDDMATKVTDRVDADGYRQLARQAREKVTAAAPATQAVGAAPAI